MTAVIPACHWSTKFTPINRPKPPPLEEESDVFPFFSLPLELRFIIYRQCCRQAAIPKEDLSTHERLPEGALTNHALPNFLRVSKKFKAEYEQETEFRRARKRLLLQFYCCKFKLNLAPTLQSPLASPVRITLANVENLMLKVRCHLIMPSRATRVSQGMNRLLSMMPSLKYIEININIACCARNFFYVDCEKEDDEGDQEDQVAEAIRSLVEETVAGLLGDRRWRVHTHVTLRATHMLFLKPLILSGHARHSWESEMFRLFADNCSRNHMLLRARSTQCVTAKGVLWEIEPPTEPEKVLDDLEAEFNIALAHRQAGEMPWELFIFSVLQLAKELRASRV
ncbi:hypothetical protein CERZMDRAFT_92649 [Cercospora zeae-maydis SCOH1-5]|uniref:F-box domain-containing protein n=1 Tax=Cercospora zeae-maydis SCOH1-5 TaxID=717836 RepID=A0A6A6FXF9_9PEZI|nr:hypothetical protein CERZMDRAFT_92649 [Cercospora zeae-maydis SCOH1-5]